MIGHTSTVTNVHPTMATSEIGAIDPYSTNPSASHASLATQTIPSGTASTNACTTHPSHTSHGILSSASGTYASTTLCTTTVLQPSLCPRWMGANA